MKEQLEQQKQQLEDNIFDEQMKDFMDWNYYDKLQAELRDVNAKLEEMR